MMYYPSAQGQPHTTRGIEQHYISSGGKAIEGLLLNTVNSIDANRSILHGAEKWASEFLERK